MDHLPETPSDPLPNPALSKRRKVRLVFALTVLVLVGGGIAAVLFLPPIFSHKEVEPGGRVTSPEDPRRSYQGVLQNIHPDVRYVGSKACVRCHGSSHVEPFAQTPMGRSLIPMAALAASNWYDQAHHNPIKAFDSLLAIERQGQRVWHSQSKGDEKHPIFQDKREVHYAIGSGNHGHSFLSLEGDGYLFQTPISWFGKKQQFWDVSPGFSEFRRRPVAAECMFCHADRAVPVEDYGNRYQVPVGGWHAIGCERCHGPGEKHIHNRSLQKVSPETDIFKKEVTEADYTIVNPGKLRPELAEAVCQQCHLEGEVRVLRRGRGLYDYRPGLPLDLFWSVFVDGRDSGEDKKAVNHVEQMVLSRCFQRSQGDNKLGCISCHSPHHVPVKESQRLQHYRDKCWKCHATADALENGKKPCKVLLAERQQANQDNCLACHMRPYGTSDIAHAASTDHRILRRPEKEKSAHPSDTPEHISLAHFHRGPVNVQDKELFRDLGIAWVRFSIRRHDPRGMAQAVEILERSLQHFPDDLEIWEEKGKALMYQQRFSEALAACETILARKPNKEVTIGRAAAITQMLGELEPAMKYLKKAVLLNPWIVDHEADLTKLLVQRGEWKEVGTPCRQWLRLSPGSEEARKIWIEYLLFTGKAAEAQAEFSRLQALGPANPQNLKAWFAELSNKKLKK
jgi:tetratricopeptide (TPR) repeat protein